MPAAKCSTLTSAELCQLRKYINKTKDHAKGSPYCHWKNDKCGPVHKSVKKSGPMTPARARWSAALAEAKKDNLVMTYKGYQKLASSTYQKAAKAKKAPKAAKAKKAKMVHLVTPGQAQWQLEIQQARASRPGLSYKEAMKVASRLRQARS